MKSLANIVIVCFLFSLAGTISAITYLDVSVDGVETDTVVLGQVLNLKYDCTPGGTIGVEIVRDRNENGIIDEGETFFGSGVEILRVTDNATPETEDFNPFLDVNPAEGLIENNLIISLDMGRWIFVFSEGADTFQASVTYVPPETLENSLSGRFIFEDLPLPNENLERVIVAIADTLMTYGAMGICDSMGEFTIGWPGVPQELFTFVLIVGREYLIHFVESLGYVSPEDTSFSVLVDGHVEDIEIIFPKWIPDSLKLEYYGIDDFSTPIDIDSLLMLEVTEYRNRYDESDTEEVISVDSIMLNVVDGYAETVIFKPRRGYSVIKPYYNNLPEECMTPFQLDEFGIYDASSETLLVISDTFYTKNDSLWFEYSYDTSIEPLDILLPFKIHSWTWGYTQSVQPRDSLVGIWVHADSVGPSWNNTYNVILEDDTLLPEEYGFYNGEATNVQVGDTLSLIIGEYDVSVMCSLVSASGGLLEANFHMQIHFHYPTYENFCYYSFDVDTGLLELNLFSGIEYRYSPSYAPDGYMLPPEQKATYDLGEHSETILFYPLDGYFWLYIDIDSDEPIDSALMVELRSPDNRHTSEAEFRTNRWQAIPIYSGFSDSCRFRITNSYRYDTYGFTRIIENNGNIPVMAGDSIYLSATMPEDYYHMDFVRDSADSWQYPIYASNFKIHYYTLSDTSLAYTYIPPQISTNSFRLPIFEEQYLVQVETPWQFDLHHFLANPDMFIRVGGPYRPDRVRRRLNSGTGEMLLTLDGYPAEYLGDDTIWLPRGDFSGVELPDYPDNEYIADLFFFRTCPDMHPWGDGSVMAFHDVCNGRWTVNLPDTFPGGFIPVVTETSFSCSNMTHYPEEWQEFPIRIPVIKPPGITGSIRRDNTFFCANQMAVDIIDASGALVLTKTPWQVHPWEAEAVYIEYFSKEGEIPHGDYKTVLHYLGWDPEFVFIYPDTVYFSYYGGSVEVDPFYIGFRRSHARITVVGLEDSLREAAYFRLTPLEGTHPMMDAPFYAIRAEFPFPDGADTAVIPLPERTWVIAPITESGLIPTPPVATLNVPIGGTSGDFRLNFDYSGYENSGSIAGRIINDSTSVDPYPIDSLKIKILSSSGTTLLREVTPNSEGYFIAENLLSPSMLIVQITSDSERPLFAEKKEFVVSVAAGETLHVGNLFVTDGDIRARIRFRGLNPLQLATFSQIRAFPYENEWMSDTVYLNYNTDASTDTFRLCSGRWQIFSPRIPGAYLMPEFYDTLMTESSVYYDLQFIYPEGLKESEFPGEFHFSAFPNPFNNAVVFKISLPEDSPVLIEIFDMSGRKVNHIYTQFKAGIHSLIWNAIGYGGAELNSGVYLYRIDTLKETRTAKGVYLK